MVLVFDATIMICPALLGGSWGWILVCAVIRGCFPVTSLYKYPPEMTPDDLDKALVPICNQLIKRIGGKNSIVFLGTIFGTHSLMQLLWYARPSFVGVASELLSLWVLKSAASNMTTDDLNKALLAIRNRLNKKYGGENWVGFFLWDIFGTQFSIQFSWYAQPWHLRIEVDIFCPWGSEGALLSSPSPIACQTWRLVIWAKHCSHYTTNLSNNLSNK